MKCIKLPVIAALAGLILLGCAPSSGGPGGGNSLGGGLPGGVSNGAISPATYVYQVRNQNLTTSSFSLGRLVFETAEIQRRVALQLGIPLDQAHTLTRGSNGDYNVTFRLADGQGNIIATYFSFTEVASASPNFLMGEVRVANPLSTVIDANTLLRAINGRIVTEIRITPYSSTSLGRPLNLFIERTLVNFVPVDTTAAAKTLNDIVIAGGAGITGTLSTSFAAAVTGTMNENNLFAEGGAISFSGARNLLDHFKVSLNSPDRSVFFTLRDKADVNNACASGEIYFSNRDRVLHAGRSYDFENLPAGITIPMLADCRLAVTEDFSTYYSLGVVVPDGVTVTGDDVVAAGNPIPSAANVVGCKDIGTADTCYYADVTVNIQNIDEVPTIAFSSTATAFAGSDEGVVAVFPGYDRFTPEIVSGNQVTGTVSDANRLTIQDTDEDASRNALPVDSVRIVNVVPAHGRAAFSVERVGPTNAYQLMTNASHLNYESFTAAELDANGKATYKITIAATDVDNSANPNAGDGGGAKTTTMTLDYEVRDVVYRPIFVKPTTGVPLIGKALSFSEGTGIIEDNNIFYVLSGVAPFLNDRVIVGRFAGVDPETGTEANLIYGLNSNDSIYNSSLGVVDSPAGTRGKQLAILSPNIAEGTDAPVSLIINHKNAMVLSAAASGNITLEADSSKYGGQSLPYQPNLTAPRFIRGVISGSITEQDITNPVSFTVPAVAALTDAMVYDAGGVANPTPRFGIVPSRVIDSFPALQEAQRLANSNFPLLRDAETKLSIDRGTGAIRALTENAITFGNPGAHLVPIYLINASELPASDSTIAQSSIAFVALTVEDVNADPVATSYDPALQQGQLRVQVRENQPRTKIATIVLTDDNNDYAGLNATISPMAGSFPVEIIPRSDSAVVEVFAKDLNFEDITNGNVILNLAVMDRGKFDYDPSTGRASLAPTTAPSTAGQFDASINVTVIDLPDAPLLNATTLIIKGSIAENAVINTKVAGIDINITNINEFSGVRTVRDVMERFEFGLSGALGVGNANDLPALSVRVSGVSTTQAALEIYVSNPNKLENAGDGLTFSTILVVRDKLSPSSIALASLAIDIIDMPYVLDLSGFNPSPVPYVAEHQILPAPGSSHRVSGFSLSSVDASKDADDVILGSLVIAPVVFEIENVRFEKQNDLDPAPATTSVLRLVPLSAGGEFGLQIIDGDFVERALFGDIFFDLVARDTRTNAIATRRDLEIRVSEANGKAIRYVETVTPAANPRYKSPPVYSVSYDQTSLKTSSLNSLTDYNNADEVIDHRDITDDGFDSSNSNALVNVKADLGTVELHPLVSVQGGGLSGRYFVDRVAARADFVTGSNTTDLQLVPASNNAPTTLKIPFTASNDVGSVGVLMENDNGELVEARADFDKYFTLVVDNDASGRFLEIRQRVLDIAGSNDKYNALDTLALFPGATQDKSLTYYLRAFMSGGSGAASYALAQFSVDVLAADVGTYANCCEASLVNTTATDTAASGYKFVQAAEMPRTPVDLEIMEVDVPVGSAGRTIATLMIQDNDLMNVQPSNLDSELGLGFVDFHTRTDDFVNWGTATITGNTASIPLVVNRSLDDIDVGSYVIRWRVTDRNAVSRETEAFTGTFNLVVKGVNEQTSAIDISLGSGRLRVDGADGPGATFAMLMNFSDPDFAETSPRQYVARANYTEATFSIVSSTGTVSRCTVDAAPSGVRASSALISLPRPVVGDTRDITYNRVPSTSGVVLRNQVMQITDTSRGTRPLVLNDLTRDFGSSNSNCQGNLTAVELGSQITQVALSGVQLGHTTAEGEGDLSTRAATVANPITAVTMPANYTITGFHLGRPSATVAQTRVNVGINRFVTGTATFQITDNDPDDGVPHDPQLTTSFPNRAGYIERSGNRFGAAWTAPSAFHTCPSQVTAVVTGGGLNWQATPGWTSNVSAGNLLRGQPQSQVDFNYRISVADDIRFQGHTCTFGIRFGEDTIENIATFEIFVDGNTGVALTRSLASRSSASDLADAIADIGLAQPELSVADSQPTLRVDASSSGDVWFELDDATSGCQVQPQGVFPANGLDSFVISQRHGSVGTDSCKDVSVWGDEPSQGAVRIVAYAGKPGSAASRVLTEVTLKDDELNGFPASVVSLELNSASSHYVLGALDTSATGVLPADHLYYFLEGRKWNFANDGSLLSYIGTAANLGDSIGSSELANYFYNLGNAKPQDAFFVDIARLATAEEEAKDTDVLPADLSDAGYDSAFFAELASHNIAGYLKISDYEFAAGRATTRNFATAPGINGGTSGTLVALTTQGIADVPGGVNLRARVCRLADVVSDDQAAPALASVACSGFDIEDARVLADTLAAKISSLNDYWQAATNAADCPGLSAGVYCGNADQSGGTLDAELGDADRDAANPVPWHFAPYYSDSYADSKEALYLTEVYAVSANDPNQKLALPLRILFEVK